VCVHYYTGTFDFNDFMGQMRMINRMGSLGGMLKVSQRALTDAPPRGYAPSHPPPSRVHTHWSCQERATYHRTYHYPLPPVVDTPNTHNTQQPGLGLARVGPTAA
jgi:hypothetical protein